MAAILGALPYAVQLLSSLPGLIKAGMDVTALIQDSTAKLHDMQANGRDPTQAEWDELDAKIKALQAELHAPGS